MRTERGSTQVVVAYVALLLAAVAVFLVIRSYGETLKAPLPPVSAQVGDHAAFAGAADNSLRHLLVALTAVIVVGRIVGRAFSLIGQPPVIGEVVGFTNFALFLGVAMSITAFPVLARILSDRGMIRSELGVVALTCAAVDDVTAWCLLAFVVGVVQASANSALWIAGATLGFIAFMFVVVRPAVARLTRAVDGLPTQGAIALTLVGVLMASTATEAIGVHAIFGAFLFGVVFPHDSALARALKQNLESFVTILLLPAFFAFTGMRTQIGLVSGVYEWLVCGL